MRGGYGVYCVLSLVKDELEMVAQHPVLRGLLLALSCAMLSCCSVLLLWVAVEAMSAGWVFLVRSCTYCLKTELFGL